MRVRPSPGSISLTTKPSRGFGSAGGAAHRDSILGDALLDDLPARPVRLARPRRAVPASTGQVAHVKCSYRCAVEMRPRTTRAANSGFLPLVRRLASVLTRPMYASSTSSTVPQRLPNARSIERCGDTTSTGCRPPRMVFGAGGALRKTAWAATARRRGGLAASRDLVGLRADFAAFCSQREGTAAIRICRRAGLGLADGDRVTAYVRTLTRSVGRWFAHWWTAGVVRGSGARAKPSWCATLSGVDAAGRRLPPPRRRTA